MPSDLKTTDNPIGHDVPAEATEVLKVLKDGGVAIVPLNVAYAIVGQSAAAIQRIFDVKQRSFEKPSGMFGSVAASKDLHVLSEQAEALRRGLAEDADLPFSIVADYRPEHALLDNVDPFVLKTSTKGTTMDMLMNAGPFHNEFARQSYEAGNPVFGSSANRSLTGSKYEIDEIEEDVLAAADIVIDHGRCRDANDQGMSSTIIDFRTFETVRAGCRYDEIVAYAQDNLGITITG